MFLKNKKTNSKIRFQQTGFRRQLQSARGYKRQGIQKVGPSYFWPKLIIGATIILVLYLIYIPNFLFVKHIQVNGASGDDQNQVTNLAQNYLKLKPLTAQGNWWFLSTSKLSDYILQHDAQITRISSIKKKFPNKIIVNTIPRVTEFSVTLPLQHFLVSNDGVVQQDITPVGTSTPVQTTGLVPVTINNASTTVSVGDKLFSHDIVSSLNLLKNPTLDHFELVNLAPISIIEHTTGGYRLLFNTKLNLTQNINQTQLILGSLTDSQKKNLYYIDMRFADKGFVCYKNTACAAPTPTNP